MKPLTEEWADLVDDMENGLIQRPMATDQLTETPIARLTKLVFRAYNHSAGYADCIEDAARAMMTHEDADVRDLGKMLLQPTDHFRKLLGIESHQKPFPDVST